MRRAPKPNNFNTKIILGEDMSEEKMKFIKIIIFKRPFCPGSFNRKPSPDRLWRKGNSPKGVFRDGESRE